MSRAEAQKTFLQVGFGGQGEAWAQCLRDSGANVEIFFTGTEKTYSKAKQQRFSVAMLSELGASIERLFTLTTEPVPVLLLCPDDQIGSVYQEFLANLKIPLNLVIAHGYSVYSGALKPKLEHRLHLFAPKAIGPKIREAYESSRFHSLKVAICKSNSPTSSDFISGLSDLLGFNSENRIETDFETETIGDLISEQLLLCGGLFTLLETTVEAMESAGIPKALIQEECYSELKLVVDMIESYGLAHTLGKISNAAKAGAGITRSRLKPLLKDLAKDTVDGILTKRFDDEYREGKWKNSVLEQEAFFLAREENSL